MERKFESELGKYIATGRRPKSTLKVGVAGAALASCALLVCLASMSMAMGGLETPGGSPYTQVSSVYDHEVDEITTDGEDSDSAVKRVMGVKYKAASPPGNLIDVPFTKFNYVMNFTFNETVDISGLGIGQLELTFTDDELDELLPGSTDFSLSGVSAVVTTDIIVIDASGAVIRTIASNVEDIMGEANGLGISVAMPTDLGNVDAGCSVLVSVTIVIENHVLHGSAIETPWVGYIDQVFDPHYGTY